MPFIVPIDEARAQYPDYTFLAALTPSEQKAAFHIRDKDGKDLCLKIIAPDYDVDRLSREIRALQSINHPNVARFREYTLSSTPNSQRHYIIEDFVTGDDLAEHLGPSKRWARADAALCFASICDGLETLREYNIVHRDLKPTNIRVSTAGIPVIIDFGLARHLDLPDLTKTEEGAGIGTPMYFAPEQFTGTKYDIDHRTDLFAVGLMMYEALVGKHPFHTKGMTRAQLRDAVCCSSSYETEAGFKALPNNWRLVLSRTLAKERFERQPTAAQLAQLLRKLANT